MLNKFGKFLLLSSTLAGTVLVSSVQADTPPTQQPSVPNNVEQMTQALSQLQSIQQLRDVDPSNWSYEALKNLVEQYGCIVGYPDRTYRGDRALTRYEFAAGLNACMQSLERRILEAKQARTTTNETQAPNSIFSDGIYSTDNISTIFNRAFFQNTGTFQDVYGMSGQFNGWLGWRNFPGSFMENSIARDSQVVETVYRDVMNQQTAGYNIRTQDLPSPYSTSLLENPSYLSPAQTNQSQVRSSGDVNDITIQVSDVIIQPGPLFR